MYLSMDDNLAILKQHEIMASQEPYLVVTYLSTYLVIISQKIFKNIKTCYKCFKKTLNFVESKI